MQQDNFWPRGICRHTGTSSLKRLTIFVFTFIFVADGERERRVGSVYVARPSPWPFPMCVLFCVWARSVLPHESREFILHSWRVLEHYNPTGKFVDVITIGGLACVIRWETPHRSILVDNSTASDGIFFSFFSLWSGQNSAQSTGSKKVSFDITVLGASGRGKCGRPNAEHIHAKKGAKLMIESIRARFPKCSEYQSTWCV